MEMKNVIIGIVGYVLLLSNFILLIILLRKKCKRRTVSSFYTLSTSDVLNSILTAIILLTNHITVTGRTSYFHRNKLISNEDVKDTYSDKFLQFYETYDVSDSNYFNRTSCNVKNLLLHDAMFLMPFTNAFISLLIFAIQCNLSAIRISDRYKNYFLFLMEIEPNPNMDTMNANTGNEELKTKKDTYKNILNATKISKILLFFQNTKFRNISERNEAIVGMSVSCQWLIPIFFTGVLYFANYQNIRVTLQTKGTECIYETPSSFYNCFLEDENVILVESAHSRVSVIPTYTDYVVNASLTPLFKENVTENDVILKVYDIMSLALNRTYHNSNDLEASNLSNDYELIRIKNNIRADVIANDIINSINSTNFEINYDKLIITEDYDVGNNVSTAENTAIVKENYEDTDKLREMVVLCTMDKCIVPTTFLRLYLLVLMFMIYFLPIALSSVLQVRGKLICQNVLNKLKERNSMSYSILRKRMIMERDNERLGKTKLSNDSYTSKKYDEDQGSSNINVISDHTYDHNYADILKESIRVDKLFGMFKASLIISIILWTPIFLQIILKVFLCVYVSTWIVDCTFLCAICNCIVRNIFNLNMIKTEEIKTNLCRKENAIYPSEENI